MLTNMYWETNDHIKTRILFNVLPEFFLVFVGEFEYFGVCRHTCSVDKTVTKAG